MKTIFLLRHAKSSWSEPGLEDHERRLNARGRRPCGLTADWMVRNGYRADLALVSSARRTQETWALIAGAMPGAEARSLPELYHATPRTMLACLAAAPDVAHVLMLGHQPGIGEFARMILADPPDDQSYRKYPTAAVAVMDFDSPSWSEIRWGDGALTDFIVPKRLDAD